MAELPAGREALDREQARRLEMPGDQGVDAVADQRGRSGDTDLQAQMGAGRPLGQVLDLQQVADHAVVGLGAERRILGQRDRIVRLCAVDHRAGHQHDPAHAAGRGGGEHGLGAADIESTPGPGIRVRRQVEVGVHDNVHVGQAPGQGRITDVDYPPGHAPNVTADVIYRHYAPDQRGLGEPRRQCQAESVRSAGDRDNWPQACRGRRFEGPSGHHGLGRLAGAAVRLAVAGPRCRSRRFLAVAALMANLGYSVAHCGPLLG